MGLATAGARKSSSRSRAPPRRPARRTRTCASAATASTSRCWGPCSRKRARAGSAARALAAAVRGSTIDVTVAGLSSMLRHCACRRRAVACLVARRRMRRTSKWSDVARQGQRADRQLQRLGRRREDQRLHPVGRRGSRQALRRQGQPRQAQGHRGGGDARRRRESGRPQQRRHGRPHLDQRAELPRA